MNILTSKIKWFKLVAYISIMLKKNENGKLIAPLLFKGDLKNDKKNLSTHSVFV